MFANDVREGLSQAGQKQLPCQYFYDDTGTALFEAITVLPEYGLTRADTRLIRRLAPELAGYLPAPVAVAELGSGSGSKTRRILESLAAPRTGGLTILSMSRPPRWPVARWRWPRSPTSIPSKNRI
jgi:L-histidine N-alpha-methyltransferase